MLNTRQAILIVLLFVIVLLFLFGPAKIYGQTMSLCLHGQQQANYETFEHWDQATNMAEWRELRDFEEFDEKFFELRFDINRGYHSYIGYVTPDIIMFWRLYPDRYMISLYRRKGTLTNGVSLSRFTLQDAHLTP